MDSLREEGRGGEGGSLRKIWPGLEGEKQIREHTLKVWTDLCHLWGRSLAGELSEPPFFFFIFFFNVFIYF